ncbi:MAG: hypothetical protein MAG551_00187 [Candidatus Scalindua arabica]|uniref:Uncharacterized protein n=1 Tax=Candidatus Scalindua arabica TaxID=1127984 RepID=A0A941W104_9BACT|nr:hypothetical protein [Candidatus Scalindua arabica]
MHIDTINLIDILENKFEKDQAKIIAKAIDEAIGESVQQQNRTSDQRRYSNP